MPKSDANRMNPQMNEQPGQNEDDDLMRIQQLRLEAAKLQEPGVQSLLEKLHEHCLGKQWFTEFHFQMNVKKPMEATIGLQKVLSASWPHVFVCRNVVILASNDKEEHVPIMLGIKGMTNC